MQTGSSEALVATTGSGRAVAAAGSSAQAPAIDIAVILPAFNEIDGIEKSITRVQAVLHTLALTSELIVVDDGSADGTGSRAASTGARVLTHQVNRGYGAALKTGILNTTASHIAIIDADCTYPPEMLPTLAGKMSYADMSVGARALSSSGVAWSRKPGKWMLNAFASYLVGRNIPDLNSGLRVARRDVLLRYLHLLPDGFSFTSTITMAMMANGHTVVYEPIEYTKRVGRSKIRPSHFFSFLMLVVRAIVLFNPLKVFLPLGTVLFVLGIAKLIQDIVRWNLSETAVMAFLSAIIVWAVGLLADMISRLQMQPPWRP
jgi:glycosyltransferase involved in cell wall biosynthesis